MYEASEFCYRNLFSVLVLSLFVDSALLNLCSDIVDQTRIDSNGLTVSPFRTSEFESRLNYYWDNPFSRQRFLRRLPSRGLNGGVARNLLRGDKTGGLGDRGPQRGPGDKC